MTRVFDIKKWGKLLIVLLSVMFLLSACTSDYNNHAVTDYDGAEAGMLKATCWQQDVLMPIYDVIGQTIMVMYDQLSQGAMSVMMIGFAIWLGLRLLKFVSAVTEDNAAEVWNEIIKKAFICLFCGLLASSSIMLLGIINNLLFPIYQAFLEFGSKILAMSDDKVASVQILGTVIDISDNKVQCSLTGNAVATLDGFPENIRTNMGCMVCAVADRLQIGRKVAFEVIAYGGVLPFIIGTLVWLTFIVVGCAFVFYLVDSIFRFGMMILLLPIFIMAYAFGPTKKWTNIGFVNIMNSAAFMMAFSIIVAMALMSMVELINSDMGQQIFNPLAPEVQLQEFSVTMMCLLMIGFLVFGSMQVAQQLTSAIIGGKVDAKFQQNLKAIGQAILGMITGGFGYALKKAGFFQKTSLGRAMKSGGALQNKLKDLAGRKD